MVDSADGSLLETAKAELLALIEKPELAGIPLLVLCNKNDLPDAMKAEELIDKLYVGLKFSGKDVANRPSCSSELSKVSGRECRCVLLTCL